MIKTDLIRQSLAFLHALDCKERTYLIATDFNLSLTSTRNLPAHVDAVWDISWSPNDTTISISADGSIRQWDSTSGQVSRSLPAHPLGLISLSVSPNGEKALFNSIEGLTSLWDLHSGEIVGKHESYTRTGTDPAEPCKCSHRVDLILTDSKHIFNSMVRVSEPKRINVCVYGWSR